MLFASSLLRSSLRFGLSSASFSSLSTSLDADVLISGGGLVGLSCALALSRIPSFSSRRIVLLQDRVYDALPVSSSSLTPTLRCSALSPGSFHFLRSLGLGSLPFTRYDRMSVWSGDDGGLDWSIEEFHRVFSGEQFPLPIEGLGFLVENAVLEARLIEAAKSARNIEICEGETIRSISPQSDGVQVATCKGGAIKGKLLIGAEGAQSPVKRAIELQGHSSGTVGIDYNQLGLVCNLECAMTDSASPESSHRSEAALTAFQRFLPSGPIAALPVCNSGRIYSIVWSSSIPHVQRLLHLSDSDLTQQINQAFHQPIKNSQEGQMPFSLPFSTASSPVSSLLLASRRPVPPTFIRVVPPPSSPPAPTRAAFPLRLLHSPSYYSPSLRSVLLGDAGHSVHPMAGQGLNLGFNDIRSLVKIVQEGDALGRPFYSPLGLERFNQRQQWNNLQLLGGVHALHTALVDKPTQPMISGLTGAPGSGLLQSVASLGMQIINQLPAAKYALAKQAMGLTI